MERLRVQVARYIRLLDWPEVDHCLPLLHPAGETGDFAELRARMQHVSLEAVPGFQEAYLGAMGFPP